MKTVKLRKSCIKDYNKLSARHKIAWEKAIMLLLNRPRHIKLRRHALKGKYVGLESIDVASDVRALFIETEERFIFYHIRNHNQLYS